MNKGRTGAPLEKLADVSRQLERFLRALSSDLNVEVKRGEWLAVNFEDGSVKYDAALQVDVRESDFNRFNESIEFVVDYDPDIEGSNGLVSNATLLEFGRIGTYIDPDEAVNFGLYETPTSRKPKKWRQISYRSAVKVKHAVERPIEAYGSIQGVMHSLVKEGDRPHFHVRELATDLLIKCLYRQELYGEIVNALRDRMAVVFVTGAMKYDRVKRQIDELRADRLDRYISLSAEELHGFFGSAPKLTGHMTTSEFIRTLRADG